MRLAFSPHYSIHLSPHHQFPMEKYRAVHAALLARGAVRPEDVLAPESASADLLHLAHTPEYVRRFLARELMRAEGPAQGPPDVVLYATGIFVTESYSVERETICIFH
jgi:acetoin utilization deacetylase AcuC-like enzyme